MHIILYFAFVTEQHIISIFQGICQKYDFSFTSLLEYNCFTMVCQFLLYNKVNQLYIYSHISSLLRLPPSLSHPSRWSQSTKLISLCYVAASHQLSVLHLVVYKVHATLSLCPRLPFPLPVCSSPFSMSASLFLSCPQDFQIPYICVSIQYLFFSF